MDETELAAKHAEYLVTIANEFISDLEFKYGLDSMSSMRVALLVTDKIQEAIERNERND